MNEAPVLRLATLEQQLRFEGTGAAVMPGWLQASYTDPRAFWEALHRARAGLSTALGRAAPFRSYDLFHELVGTHSEANRTALIWFDASLGRQQLSFRELGALASARAHRWTEAGVQAGDRVCIVGAMGPEVVVSLVAAVRLGAVVSLLPCDGALTLAHRIGALAPKWIATEEIYESALRPWRAKLLGQQRLGELSGGPAEGSFTYPSGSIVARLVDHRRGFAAVTELSVDQLYLTALRDGLLALGLRPGQTHAAPGRPLLDTQPNLLVAGLISGAALLHLDIDQLRRDPAPLASEQLAAVGVSSELRELLVARQLDVGGSWSYWYRDPGQSYDLTAWQRFIMRCGLRKTLTGNLSWSAGPGGALLFSPRRPAHLDVEVWPSAGSSWELREPLGTTRPATDGAGCFAWRPLGAPADKTVLTGDLLVRRESSWTFAGSIHQGEVPPGYPRTELLTALGPLRPGARLALCVRPAATPASETELELLVFDPSLAEHEHAALRAAIIQHIEAQFGSVFLPQQIRFVPLMPHFTEDGAIDERWCRDQLVSGALSERSRDRLYLLLSRLRWMLDRRSVASSETAFAPLER